MNIYNQNKFLAPESINSAAIVQTKIHENGIAILRISDCNRSIKIWNDLNDSNGRDEMIEKLSTLQTAIEKFKNEVLKVDYEIQYQKGEQQVINL